MAEAARVELESSDREGASGKTVLGAKPECGEEDWRTGGGGAEEGRE